MIKLVKRKKINWEVVIEIFSLGMVLVLVIIWWLEFYYFTDIKKELVNLVPRKTIMVLGDSLSSGYGVGPEFNYVSILRKKINQPIIVSARSGRTTSEALLVLDSELLTHKPDIVIVLLGGNDFLKGVPKYILFYNLRQIVNRVKSTGAEVILVGIPAGFSAEYDREFEILAQETSSIYVPNILRGIIGVKEFLWDQIHPNFKGHQIMAERIYKVLLPLLYHSKNSPNL